jgi:hypothetical protein
VTSDASGPWPPAAACCVAVSHCVPSVHSHSHWLLLTRTRTVHSVHSAPSDTGRTAHSTQRTAATNRPFRPPTACVLGSDYVLLHGIYCIWHVIINVRCASSSQLVLMPPARLSCSASFGHSWLPLLLADCVGVGVGASWLALSASGARVVKFRCRCPPTHVSAARISLSHSPSRRTPMQRDVQGFARHHKWAGSSYNQRPW